MPNAVIFAFVVAAFVSCTDALAPFLSGQELGKISSSHIDEVSGLAASRVHENILYAHNDKGDSSRIFAVNAESGEKVAEFDIDNARNYDWEDIALGPCVDDCNSTICGAHIRPSRYCLYIADIGDHGGDGAINTIYMVREPLELKDRNIDLVSQLKFSWPEEDAETLMVSPVGDLFIVSKVKHAGAKMAQLPNAAWDGARVALDMTEAVTVLVSTDHSNPQGGDISPSGSEMLLVFEEAMYYYKVNSYDYLKTVSEVVPELVNSYTAIKSTEAVAWRPDGDGGFYTAAEGDNPTIVYYPREFSNLIG